MQNIYAQTVSFEYGTIFTAVLFCAVLVGLVIGVLQFWLYLRANAMYYEVSDWIRDHRRKLIGSNRFVINELLLRSRFPEYDHKIVSKVWRRIRDEQLIVIDDKDGEWCIK